MPSLTERLTWVRAGSVAAYRDESRGRSRDGVDPATGFERVRSGRRVLRVANLVDDGPGRDKVMASLRAVRRRDDVDVIIALGMAKEGFDWIWCEHVLTVGYRGSLTEVVQIIGRATRDAPGKTSAKFTNLVSAPFAKDEVVSRAVNDMLKAISVSLLMAPTFKFMTHKGSDDMTGEAAPTSATTPVTNIGEIEVVNGPVVAEAAQDIITADFPDLFANVQIDPRTVTVMLNPDDHHADVIHDMVVTDIIRRRYAGVTIVDTYELVGHSAKEAERLLHRQLARHNVVLKVTGRDGRPHKATEWFKTDPETVADALAACFGRAVRTVEV